MMKLILFFISVSIFSQVGLIQNGKASFYHDRFHGAKTASGEKYDMNSYTAAHRELPFQTKIKVTNLKNNKSVIARVNDRGPFSHSRVVDLSKIAAKEIGMIEDGVVNVRVEVVEDKEEETKDTKPETNNSKTTSLVKPNKSEPKDEVPKKDPKKEITVKTETKKEIDNLKEEQTKEIQKIKDTKKELSAKLEIDLKDATTENFKLGHIYNPEGMILNPKGFGLQLGYFSYILSAMKFCKELNEKGFTKLFIIPEKDSNYRVFLGEFETELDALSEINKVKEKNLEYLFKKYPESKVN